MSTPADSLGVVQWHPTICPRHRWLRICIQLYGMQMDIERAKQHTTGTGLGV